MNRFRTALLVATCLFPAIAQAEDGENVRPGEDVHVQVGDDVLVTAPFARDRFALPTAITVLEGDRLTRETRSTIGETLSRQPGVSATWFGPNSSRPVLRGMDAERVRILTDGIGSFDVSNTSADHAVAINPLSADRVEVVRGPASLLYGSSAIGGVVNVTDRSIPRTIPDEAFHLDALGTLGSAANERNISASIDMPITGGLVGRVDGSFLETGDYRTGGHVFSRALRAGAAAIGGEVAEQAEARGRVANTSARNWQLGGGLAYIGEAGSLGVALSHIASNYGVPGILRLEDDHEGHDHDHEDEHSHDDIRVDMRQTRLDARAEVPLGGGFFETLKGRFGYADYRHDEIEPNGEIGTSFMNEALEGRLELVQTQRGSWKGAVGAQYFSRRFEAVGEEAYIPLNFTDQTGLFTLQSVKIGIVDAEFGARFEHTLVQAPTIATRRSFNAVSASGGLSVPIAEGLRLSTSLVYAERAPSAEELFANGAHLATQAFEIGDPTLSKEKSYGIEAAFKGRGDGWRFEFSGFFNRFADFIYVAPNGLIDAESELPIFAYGQAGARYWGLEAESSYRVAQLGKAALNLTAMADFVRADLLEGRGPVPRIPPLRFIAGIEAEGGPIGGRIEIEHVTKQTRLAQFETQTPAFTLLNASATWHPMGDGSPTTLILAINNLFDVEARRHASFLKDYAPLPGRDVRVTARLSF